MIDTMKTTRRATGVMAGCLMMAVLAGVLWDLTTTPAARGAPVSGVPAMINYQGRVSVAGVNFDGTGQFKFALVNANGTTTYWSNDGTASGTPALAVSVPVNKGLYSVKLGDTALMTALGSAVFAGSGEVYLRAWFNDGVHGFQLLSPDQRIVSSAYALVSQQAAAVVNGDVSLGADPVAPLDAATKQYVDAMGVSSVSLDGTVLRIGQGGQTLAVDLTSLLSFGFMDFVTVADAGNAADTTGFGAVSYDFKIGKHEVTNSQYAEFLNAVAATDPDSLYNTNMDTSAYGGITRAGVAGSYTYAVKAGMGNKPVVYLNWFDATRFCNWMHHGRPASAHNGEATETGAYTLTGTSSVAAGNHPEHGANGRNADAKFFIPAESEWYKAAYYQPPFQGGDTDGYWFYPTQDNLVPVAEAPPGGGSSANYNSVVFTLTQVGAYSGSGSYYGGLDLAGNVWEWTEEIIASSRGLRGGSWASATSRLESSYRATGNPTGEGNDSGFRIASLATPNNGTGMAAPQIIGTSAIVLDNSTGEVLFEKDADDPRAIASTQKLLTALLVAEAGNLDQMVTVAAADPPAGAAILGLTAGDSYTRQALLEGMLIPSGADATRCLARTQAGSYQAFVDLMNQRAIELGMGNSHFANSTGLTETGQYSTARDIGKLAMAAMRNPVIAPIIRKKTLDFVFANSSVTTFASTNLLLTMSPYCHGMKTGHTSAAGRCLVSCGSREGRTIIVVVLNSTLPEIWDDSIDLLHWGLGVSRTTPAENPLELFAECCA